MTTDTHRRQALRVRPSDHAVGSPHTVAVDFEDPWDGSDVPVEVVPFQNDDYGNAYGVAVYFLDDHGERVRGTVLRWDRGPDAKPTVIRWRRPHCADDVCGRPCHHEQAS